MMRNRFDEQLKQLNDELITMGSLCEQAISSAAEAMMSGNKDSIEQVKAADAKIDRMERDIETLCLKLLLQQQPVARDLRQISAALKMITDMERIGDQACDIAEILDYLNGRTSDECSYITDMAAATIKMVTESVDAFISRDITAADAVVKYDDVVDKLFDNVKNSLIEFIRANPANGEYATDFLMIAKYFERIGDHATNIAEWVIFSVTGVHKSDEDA